MKEWLNLTCCAEDQMEEKINWNHKTADNIVKWSGPWKSYEAVEAKVLRPKSCLKENKTEKKKYGVSANGKSRKEGGELLNPLSQDKAIKHYFLKLGGVCVYTS